MKKVLFIISLFIGTASYTQENNSLHLSQELDRMGQKTSDGFECTLGYVNALEYTHGKMPQQNTVRADLSEIDVPDSRGKRVEKSFKMDSLRLEMKVLHPDLWKKYRRGHFECSMGTSFVIVGSLSAISGLVMNLTGNSDQKRNGKRLMIVGGTMTAIGIPIFAVGVHTSQSAIRDCEKRMQTRQAELQFGIMSSGGLGLALKF